MKDVLDEVSAWSQRGERIAMATVIDVKRSAPRPPGAKMAITLDGEIAGAVSGGCVEGAVVEIAEQVLDGAPPRLVHYGIADSDAWDVGLPCGGEIDVWIQEYHPGRFAEIARAGGRPERSCWSRSTAPALARSALQSSTTRPSGPQMSWCGPSGPSAEVRCSSM